MTALYQGSGFKTTANESGKNATHSLLSLGTITKTLSGAALGFRTDEPETQRLLHANAQEQQVIVLHRLLSLGVIRDNMLMEPETQKRYIRQILREFPQLITITISKPKQTPTDASTRTIDYTGVQVDHVYPLGKQEALDKLRTRYANSEGIFELEKQSNVIQRLYTNIEHKNTTKVPYNFRHFTIELLLTNQFLFCDIMKPTQSAISNYETLSPTHTQIEDTRKHLLYSIDI